MFHHWRHIVIIYTLRYLTFDRDIMPALLGLATLVQSLVLSPYLGGLWSENIHRQLL
jgi:hypothetical protein